MVTNKENMMAEISAAAKLETIVAELTRKRNAALEIIAKFVTDLQSNADYHFSWADRPMSAAATERVSHIILEDISMALEAKKEPADIIEHAKRNALQQVLRYAQFPERSTSVTSNAMSQFRGVAWAEMNEYLSHI
jgi:hypothetical protein